MNNGPATIISNGSVIQKRDRNGMINLDYRRALIRLRTQKDTSRDVTPPPARKRARGSADTPPPLDRSAVRTHMQQLWIDENTKIDRWLESERTTRRYLVCENPACLCVHVGQREFIVFANEVASECPCQCWSSTSCSRKDSLFNMSEVAPGRFGLGPVLKSTMLRIFNHLDAEQPNYVPVYNIRSFCRKHERPSFQDVQRSAIIASDFGPGGIALYCGVENAELFDALFVGVPFFKDSRIIKRFTYASPADDAATAVLSARPVSWRSSWKVVYYRGSLHIAMKQHLAYEDNDALGNLLQSLGFIASTFKALEVDAIKSGHFRRWLPERHQS